MKAEILFASSLGSGPKEGPKGKGGVGTAPLRQDSRGNGPQVTARGRPLEVVKGLWFPRHSVGGRRGLPLGVGGNDPDILYACKCARIRT